MKLFQIPMLSMSLLGLCLLSGLDAPPARADFTFGAPVNVFPFLDPDLFPFINCFSADGLEVYIESYERPGGYGLMDLWVLKRASVENDWGPPENLGPLVNSATWDKGASISADGLELYFHSFRPGGYGQGDLYVTKRATRTGPWGLPTNLGPKVNGSSDDFLPWVSPDGLELTFGSSRPGAYGGADIYVSTRATTNDPWGDPVNVGPSVNSPAWEGHASPSPDGLVMFFVSDRLGGHGEFDIWITRRAQRSAPWEPAVNLGPIVNGPIMDFPASLAPDDSALYFVRASGSTCTNWKTPILPIVDFNGDQKVDLVDLVMLIDSWGMDDALCDIGPMPWGDGKVDIEDLKVFMTYYEKQNLPAQP